MERPPTPTITITKRTTVSTRTSFLQTLIHPFGAQISKPGQPLSADEAGSPRLHPPRFVTKQCCISERKVEGVYIYDIYSKLGRGEDTGFTKPAGRTHRIYYIAGGSFCQPPSRDHWKFVIEMARKVPNSMVSLISPPLAPHFPAPVTLPRLARLFGTLLESRSDSETVSFAGDSSGGNLVLSGCIMMLGEDAGAVKGLRDIMLIAPVVDLRFENPGIEEVQKRDPVLRRDIEVRTAKAWAGSWDLANPRLSLLLADLGILRDRGVRVHGVTGGYDILTPDTLLFRDKCQDLGIFGEWLEWEKQMHCFPLAFGYHLPESIEGKDWVVDVLAKNA